MAAAAILDFCTNSNNSGANWRRWMKFCRNVDGCYQKWNVWPKWTKIINSKWRRPPFWISSIAYNSFAIAHICTKFGKCITLEFLHARMPKYWTKIKSKMVVTTILDFCTNSNNSAANWHINDILQCCRRLLPEVDHVTKFDKSNKFKMASAAILNSVYRL